MKKTLKKLMACLLSFAMVMSSLMASPDGIFGGLGMVQTAHAATITPSQPENGDGSAENPYQIGTAAELYWFAGLVNGDPAVCTQGAVQTKDANAVLTEDITVNTGVMKEDGSLIDKPGTLAAWTPIGTESKPYTGTFDGRGHTINGLYLWKSTGHGFGLFGFMESGGKVCNVGVTGSYIKGGSYYTGGVCVVVTFTPK